MGPERAAASARRPHDCAAGPCATKMSWRSAPTSMVMVQDFDVSSVETSGAMCSAPPYHSPGRSVLSLITVRSSAAMFCRPRSMVAPIIASFCAAAFDCAIAAAVGLQPVVCTSQVRPRGVVTVLVLLSRPAGQAAAAFAPAATPTTSARDRGSRRGMQQPGRRIETWPSVAVRAAATPPVAPKCAESDPKRAILHRDSSASVRVAVRDAERHQPSTVARLRARTGRRNPVFAEMDRRAPRGARPATATAENDARDSVGTESRHRGSADYKPSDTDLTPGRPARVRYAAMRTFAGPAAARPMRRACG